ncbi:MAG TPA: rhodanese-like domain-containing protein [Acetobacteraceae bacterium]|nr:rhodanese-like domain-containing protein [Acetobacteraceae bacterium]
MASSIGRIPPTTVREWILDGHELALLDAREEGEFGAGHLFWAVPCPLSRAELRVPMLLPRLSVRTVCTDDGRGVAERLAEYLVSKGATDVHVLDGGTKAWAEAGYVLFTGVNVPSKAFGEWVEHHYGTESVDAPELKRWQDEGRDLVILDSRPMDEFHRMSIPGGINVPGGELAYRIGDLAPDPNTLIVVNCAGRTRSILGAESLRRAGVPNRVLALRNGTMGWELAGLAVERGRTERYPQGKPKTARLALERARAFAEASGVGVIGPLDLDRFEEDPDRTLYVLDVRDPAEFAARHRPGSRNAPGGQLIQATDNWIGVRGARIALIDDDGVRARMSGAWLRQMGHRDVFVVEGGLDDLAEPGPAVPLTPEVEETDTIPEGAVVLDLARSIEFRAGHIPGAIWGVRTRLNGMRDMLGQAKHVVITSPDGVLARLAVPEVKGMTDAPVQVLRGGTKAWAAAGGQLVADKTNPPDEACIDFYLRPYDRNAGIGEAMQAYLSWEIDLVREIERDGTVAFGV